MPSKRLLVLGFFTFISCCIIVYTLAVETPTSFMQRNLCRTTTDSAYLARFCRTSPPAPSPVVGVGASRPLDDVQRPSSSSLLVPSRSLSLLPFHSSASISSASISSAARAMSTAAIAHDPPTSSQLNGSTGSLLGDTLLTQKEAFLQDLNDGKGAGWTVVMGNEAGDLDSLASAIAYAHLSTVLLATPKIVALLQTPRSALPLRPENTLALELAHVLAQPSPLICLDDLPVSPTQVATQGVQFVLVDHNRLLPVWHKEDGAEPKVVAVIDHHADEKLYLDASPRIIKAGVDTHQGAGSCASLVALHFQEHLPSASSTHPSPIPADLANLLICSILVDTSGLKAGGKGTPLDRAAAAFLYPFSSFADSSPVAEVNFFAGEVPTSLKTLSTRLSETKRNVSNLTTKQLLERDYKQYDFASPLVAGEDKDGQVRLGLASVPIGLEEWWSRKEPSSPWKSFVEDLEKYCVEKKLDVLGVGTSFKSVKKHKSKREILVYFPSSTPQTSKLHDAIIAGLEASAALGLQPWVDSAGLMDVNAWGKAGAKGKAWKQGNVEATRKTIAPVMKAIIEGAPMA